MLKETIHFTDFNGNPSTTVEYFNLSKNEIIDLEASVEGGLANMMRKVEDNPTARGVLDLLKILAHAAYGIKSDDGKYFDKSEEITNKFIRSAFYDDFLFSLVENDGQKGLAFIRGVLPPQLLDAAERQLQTQQNSAAASTAYEPSARERFAAAQAASAESGAITQPPTAFGQPARPQFNNPEIQVVPQSPAPQPYPGPQNDAEWSAFQQWQAQQDAAKQAAPVNPPASAPASPDAFRVREEEPMQGLPRPPHEQVGEAQP